MLRMRGPLLHNEPCLRISRRQLEPQGGHSNFRGTGPGMLVDPVLLDRWQDGMNEKTTQKCNRLVTLAPGEQITLTEAVQIGKVSAKKQIATSAVVGVLTAGTVIVHLKPAAFYLVLTNQRLILIGNNRGLVGTVALTVPLNQVTVVEPLHGHALTLSMEVDIAGTQYRFSWGRAQAGMARKVATAMPDGS
jgi:hypothetical protein